MRITCGFLLGLVAISIGLPQVSEAQAVMTRVYDGDDFEDYYSDPPYWSYHSKGLWDSKSAHWLYENHRYVFIDIKLNYADSR
jgi:hypothetical protein